MAVLGIEDSIGRRIVSDSGDEWEWGVSRVSGGDLKWIAKHGRMTRMEGIAYDWWAMDDPIDNAAGTRARGEESPEAMGANGEIDQDLSCPMCGYNLRGLREARCPECGYACEWEDLIDPTRRLHPYLFEHHPEKNVASFLRTAVGTLFRDGFGGICIRDYAVLDLGQPHLGTSAGDTDVAEQCSLEGSADHPAVERYQDLADKSFMIVKPAIYLSASTEEIFLPRLPITTATSNSKSSFCK